MVAQVDSVHSREAVPEPVNKTIKVTETNKKRLTALAGELAKDGEFHSHNDAINYLFDNRKEKLK